MIDLQNETVIRLGDVPAYLPKHPNGRRPHVACVYRWVQRGCNGIKLEVINVGGIMATSVEALQRFCDRCTAAEHGTAPEARTSRQRQRAIEAAERELSEAGI
jgi:hypothetical protein